jgi:ATP-dependent Clp protease ATP-binding subunit ClpB
MLSERDKSPLAYWVDNDPSFTEKVMGDLKSFFRPEFLNRVDEVIIFNPLTQPLLKQIVDIQVERMKQYIRERGIDVRLTESAKEYFAKTGFDPVYGARPLKRVLQKMILNELALKILDGTYTEGDTVEVDYADGKVLFQKVVGAEMVS